MKSSLYFAKEKNGNYRKLTPGEKVDDPMIEAMENDNRAVYQYTEKLGVNAEKKGLVFVQAYIGNVLTGAHVSVSCPVESTGFVVDLCRPDTCGKYPVPDSFKKEFEMLLQQHTASIKELLD